MKKIPTLFERTFDEKGDIVGISPKVTEGMEWVLEGDGVATVKYDGACCCIINGFLFKRYDAKKGKKPPEGAIPCCPPDPITGHHPHWVKCNREDPADKWFYAAFDSTKRSYGYLGDGTYEAIGPHFQGNPYNLSEDILVRHGTKIVAVNRTFQDIKAFLWANNIEGLVFWKGGEPQCKIKRTDFDFPWNSKKARTTTAKWRHTGMYGNGTAFAPMVKLYQCSYCDACSVLQYDKCPECHMNMEECDEEEL